MSDENIVSQEQLIAAIKRTSDETKGSPNLNEIFNPATKVNIVSVGTPEHDARKKKREEELRRASPLKPVHVPYHVRDDGTWEQRFATEEQLAERRKAEDVPLHTFKAVVDPNRRRWALRQGSFTKFFKSSDEVSRHCRRESKGERSILEFYEVPRPIDDWLGDDFGDFINSESW